MGDEAVILPSPLLPAIAYDGLAKALESKGARARVVGEELADGEGGADLIARWATQVGPATWLLAHSNAGFLAPAVRHLAGGRHAIVFMDAALAPAGGATTLARGGFLDHLVTLADSSGVLPPWTRWWPRADLAEVVPPDLYDELDRRCPRLPLSYFETPVDVPTGWLGEPNAYLAFGDTYRDEVTVARREGWPTRHIPGGHLHFLHDPGAVADAALQLVARLRSPHT